MTLVIPVSGFLINICLDDLPFIKQEILNKPYVKVCIKWNGYSFLVILKYKTCFPLFHTMKFLKASNELILQ